MLLTVLKFLLHYLPLDGVKSIMRTASKLLYHPPEVIHLSYDNITPDVQALLWMSKYGDVPIQTMDGPFSLVVPEKLRVTDTASAFMYTSRVSMALPSAPERAAELLDRSMACLSLSEVDALVNYVYKNMNDDSDYLCGYQNLSLMDFVACSCLVSKNVLSIESEEEKVKTVIAYVNNILDELADDYDIVYKSKDE